MCCRDTSRTAYQSGFFTVLNLLLTVMNDKRMKKQVHVFYSGKVQGVGFRAAAKRIAEELGVYGWVRNLDDGRVELAAEGEEAALKEMLDGVQGIMGAYITAAKVEWREAGEEFEGFEVRC